MSRGVTYLCDRGTYTATSSKARLCRSRLRLEVAHLHSAVEQLTLQQVFIQIDICNYYKDIHMSFVIYHYWLWCVGAFASMAIQSVLSTLQ